MGALGRELHQSAYFLNHHISKYFSHQNEWKYSAVLKIIVNKTKVRIPKLFQSFSPPKIENCITPLAGWEELQSSNFQCFDARVHIIFLTLNL